MEKKIHKSYKYRIYPTKEQETFLLKHFGAVRFVYNYFLAERQEQYHKNGKSDRYYEQCRALTALKRQEEYSWLKEVNSQTLQSALGNLESAFVNFYDGRTKYPKFKKKRDKNTFCVPQYSYLKDGRVFIPKLNKMGGIKAVIHRKLEGKILYAIVSKTLTNKYYISFVTEQMHTVKDRTGKDIGVDLGIKDLAIDSNGHRFKNHKFMKQFEPKLKAAQRHLSRKKYGSKGWEKQRIRLALVHEKIHNCHMDVIHKASHKLIQENDAVYVENLNISNMMKNRNWTKAIRDCCWYTFKRFLSYKGEWDNVTVHEIYRFFPSSKTCHSCGHVMDKMPLNIRTWECPKCHKVHDRDVNAAINILLEGRRELEVETSSVGTTDYTDGQVVRPSKRKSNKADLNEVRSS